jgi:putative ABC transport system ATP-binding protein
VIELHGLTKVYRVGEREVRALDGIDLEVPDGEFVVVMGPSGCGKSTLLNLIGGIDAPTGGRVVVDGEDVSRMGDRALTAFRRSKVGFVFQSFNLVSTLTAAENVELALRLRGLRGAASREEAGRFLELVGVGELADRFPSEMSGGQQQRAAIARALAKEPTVLLADEPTGSIDRASGRVVVTALRDSAKQLGRTTVLATHDPSLAEVADRLVTLVDGRVTEDRQQRGGGSGGGGGGSGGDGGGSGGAGGGGDEAAGAGG